VIKNIPCSTMLTWFMGGKSQFMISEESRLPFIPLITVARNQTTFEIKQFKLLCFALLLHRDVQRCRRIC